MASGITNAGHVPLFDRLMDEEPHVAFESVPYRTLSREQLHLSIQAEIDRVLSTRCMWRFEDLASHERSIVNYGLPDLDSSQAQPTGSQHRQLALLLRSTIEAFEPRLQDVKVELHPRTPEAHLMTVAISGSVLIDEVTEPVSFTVALGDRADRYAR